ncbi:MAG: restriction endonuclease subunit S [Gemmatimonas sp.]|uniref:restriction endonuclease subunit S n=1 Tax=Gemmatimonas sp. TaxID=1962908 RepID=UPI00391F4C5E
MHKPNDNLLNGELRRFKTYPTYKSSGVEWLGDIPAGWGVNRLKEVATIQMSNVDKKSVDGEDEVELCNYTDVYYHDRITPDMPFMKATAPREQVRRFALRAGDVLITKDSESWTDIAVPAVVVADMPNVLCGYHLAHIRPKTAMDGAYLSRAIAAVGPRDQFRVAANGVTRFAIGTEAITTAVFAVPPLSEQRAIAAFLDRETARIDALVSRKERLITLLQEQRTALITRAVTKCLNPTAPMKDSGVEWLGEIPAHWEDTRLRRVLTWIEQGWSPDCENRPADEDEWGVLKAGCVNRGEFVESEHKTLPQSERPILELEIREGDLLMSRASGSRDLVGSVAVVRKCRPRLLLCDKVFRLHVDERHVGKTFAAHALNSRVARSQIESVLSGGSGLANNIAQSVVKDLMIALPPRDEQEEITTFIDDETARLDGLIAHIRNAIVRLNELRTALISAAVTGKIDVRYSTDPATDADATA